MSKANSHLEFVNVELHPGCAPPEGYPPGCYQKILASDIDEVNKRGSRTRLLKIEPGAFSTAPFVHDHWEEVYQVQGDVVAGNDAQGRGGQRCFAATRDQRREVFLRPACGRPRRSIWSRCATAAWSTSARKA